MKDCQKRTITCPFCKGIVNENFEGEIGEIVECQKCGTELEIVDLDPFKYQELIEEK